MHMCQDKTGFVCRDMKMTPYMFIDLESMQ